jgi:LPXTG-motif cell wall-anchored protein
MSAAVATRRGGVGTALIAVGALLVAVAMILIIPANSALALDDPNNPNKELICHNLNGPTQPSDGISVAKASLSVAHPDAGHQFDIIEGQYSETLGRVAVASDIAIILEDGTIVWVCGGTPPTTTTTTTTIAETTTTLDGETTTTTQPQQTTTSAGGPTTTAAGGPDLPNTGGAGNLMSVLLGGMGLLLIGVGFLVLADERRRLEMIAG